MTDNKSFRFTCTQCNTQVEEESEDSVFFQTKNCSQCFRSNIEKMEKKLWQDVYKLRQDLYGYVRSSVSVSDILKIVVQGFALFAAGWILYEFMKSKCMCVCNL